VKREMENCIKEFESKKERLEKREGGLEERTIGREG
jgi:hypothetical protein